MPQSCSSNKTHRSTFPRAATTTLPSPLPAGKATPTWFSSSFPTSPTSTIRPRRDARRSWRQRGRGMWVWHAISWRQEPTWRPRTTTDRAPSSWHAGRDTRRWLKPFSATTPTGTRAQRQESHPSSKPAGRITLPWCGCCLTMAAQSTPPFLIAGNAPSPWQPRRATLSLLSFSSHGEGDVSAYSVWAHTHARTHTHAHTHAHTHTHTHIHTCTELQQIFVTGEKFQYSWQFISVLRNFICNFQIAYNSQNATTSGQVCTGKCN